MSESEPQTGAVSGVRLPRRLMRKDLGVRMIRWGIDEGGGGSGVPVIDEGSKVR